jgi:hypothetical protein
VILRALDDVDAEFGKLREMVRTLSPPEQQRRHLGFLTTLEYLHRTGEDVQFEAEDRNPSSNRPQRCGLARKRYRDARRCLRYRCFW